MAEIKITKENFEEEVLNSSMPVLVDFWATWCGPCKMLAPILSEIAEQFEGVIKVGKVNVDEENSLAAGFGINSIPTVILFKNGKAVQQAVGYYPKEKLLEFFEL